jgi:adenosine deaminase
MHLSNHNARAWTRLTRGVIPRANRQNSPISVLTTMTTPAPAFWQNVPKVVLHEHLDGNLRPLTLLDLCHQRGIALPADTPEAIQHWIHTQANSGSLERYVAAFGLTVAAMASAEACERVAFEAVQDCAADGAVLIELRMAPLLLEEHGLACDDALAAMLAGMQRGSEATGIPAGFIVCGMRTDANQDVMRSAQLAARFAGKGVVGYDLAGAERGFPATLHANAVALARDAGLGITLHAGEADVGQRVMEAMALGATRIGHGVQITQGEGAADRVARAREAGVHFEVCPTSNVHTGAWKDLATHPLRAMEAEGLNWSVQADNRLISVLTQSSELQVAHEVCGLSVAQIMRGHMDAARASFLPSETKNLAIARIQAWCERNPVAIN